MAETTEGLPLFEGTERDLEMLLSRTQDALEGAPSRQIGFLGVSPPSVWEESP